MIRDLRKYARQTAVRLIVGALLILFIIGDGLIYIFYGRNSAIMGLLCLLAGLTPVALTLFALLMLDWVAKKAGGE